MSETANVTSMAEARKKLPFAVKQSWFGPPDTHWWQCQAMVPAGTKFKDLLVAEAWVHVAHVFRGQPNLRTTDKIGSTILVMTDDCEWRAEFLVLKAMESGLQVKCIGPVIDANGNGQPQYLQTVVTGSDKYRSQWVVGSKGYNIIRNSDNSIVANARQLKTREDVNEWLAKAD